MPKVYDKNGRELTVGVRVVRVLPNGRTGNVVGKVRLLGGVDPGDVYVKWPGRPYGSPFKSRRRFTPSRTYTCRDLLLIDSPTEGKEG